MNNIGLPPEFKVLGYKPEPWEIKDIFAIFKRMEVILATSGSELYNLKVNSALGKERAEELGFISEILSSDEQGDVKSASKRYGELIRRKFSEGKNFNGGILLLSGGEFTVNVTGKGAGGRVQEFLLLLIHELKDIASPFFIAGVGTDGQDGKTDAAGAWINENTYKLSGNEPEVIISRHLENNDSYNYFKKLNQLIYTGPTGTNVMDIFLFFLG